MVNDLSPRMIDEYVAWGDKIRVGDAENMMYREILDFVNFRVETAASCLDLIEQRHIADALGLCRSLLENYLLLMLMCRGRKFFRLQDLSGDKTEGQFKQYLAEQQTKLADQHARGEALVCLEVAKYPRAKRHLMYVFEGLRDKDDPNFFIPVHYFEFREFQPEAMRLRDEDYFDYFKPDPELVKAAKGHMEEATLRYKHYLSYDALLQCLELNDLMDVAARLRLEAHYTFLGKYLHPTHEAARDLHEDRNVYGGHTAIGMEQTYTGSAVLLASLYVCYCLSSILDEVAGLFEAAPPKYIADAGTASLRSLTSQVPQQFSYFWFLLNEAPLYDKFMYAVYHLSDAELAAYGGYANVPGEQVPFDQNIYGHLQGAIRSQSNARCGVYRSPLGS
jgi:hypothetical protein